MREVDDKAGRCVSVGTPSRHSVVVELASTSAARARGLSERDGLSVDGLLLEWPDAGRHSIWMAGMRFALDLVWLDDDGRVSGVIADMPPCPPGGPCALVEPDVPTPTRAVLELPAGQAKALGLAPGAYLLRTAIPPPRL